MSTEPLPDGTLASEHLGVRVGLVTANSAQELTDRIALYLGEHMADDDEFHISFNAMQNGSELRQQKRMFGSPEHWAELYFEYSALLVLRQRDP